MDKIISMLVPLSPIKRLNYDFRNSSSFKTSNIDTVSVGIGPGNIERFNPADAAEQVLCHARVEPIARKKICASEQNKSRFWNDQMNKAALAADRAVAFDRFNFCTRLDLEFHTPAMAAAHMFNQAVSHLESTYYESARDFNPSQN
jgi:hypothetical protein